MLRRISLSQRIREGIQAQERAIGIATLSAARHRRAGALAKQGANLTAAAYRQAAQSNLQIANYNISVDQFNTSREVEHFRADVDSTLSSQRAAATMAGFDVSSKSFMAIQHETLSAAERAVIDIRNSAGQRRKNIMFQAQLDSTSLENQARATEFAGSVAAWQSDVEATLALAEAERLRIPN